jgi:hypothetical protein
MKSRRFISIAMGTDEEGTFKRLKALRASFSSQIPGPG